MNAAAKLSALNRFRSGAAGLVRQVTTKVLVVYDVQVKNPEVAHVPLIINYGELTLKNPAPVPIMLIQLYVQIYRKPSKNMHIGTIHRFIALLVAKLTRISLSALPLLLPLVIPALVSSSTLLPRLVGMLRCSAL
jgi:hypothetical protein